MQARSRRDFSSEHKRARLPGIIAAGRVELLGMDVAQDMIDFTHVVTAYMLVVQHIVSTP